MDELFEFMAPFDFTFSPQTYQYFHQLIQKRTIILNEDISETLVESVYLPLKDFEEDESQKPVTLILNSNGGSVSDGLFLAEYISVYKKPLNIMVLGYAASMATILLCGGGKNPNVTRYCFPSSYGLLHDGYVALKATEQKTAEDIMEYNKTVNTCVRQMIIDNTNITQELYDSKARHQWFLTAKEMKELGLIDKIIGCDE